MTSSKLVRLLWKAYISCTDWGLVPWLRKECVYLWFWNRNHFQVTWFLLINKEYGQVKRQGSSYSVVFVFYKLLLQRISGSFPGAYKTCEKYFYSGRFSWLSQMSGLDLCVERSRHKWCYPMGKNRPKIYENTCRSQNQHQCYCPQSLVHRQTYLDNDSEEQIFDKEGLCKLEANC